MTWLALRALLSRIPLTAYAIALAVLLIAGAGVGLVVYGEHREQRAAHVVVVKAQRVKVDTASHRADAAITTAGRLRNRGDSARAIVRRLAPHAAADLEFAPATVRDLVTAQQEVIGRDSVTMAASFAAIDSLLKERGARVALDSLEEDLTPAPHGHGKIVAKIVAVGAAVVLVVKVLPKFFRRTH